MRAAYPSRCLVAGASGQVGTQIMSILGPERCVAASRAVGRSGWVHLDLAELAGQPGCADNVITELHVGAVYCAGAMTDVERCESEPEMAMNVNCHGPAALADAAARHGIPFAYFSSEYVFDGRGGPYTEDAAPNPINVYGRSKWMGEQAIRKVHPNPLIIRTTVVYGRDPRGRNFLYGLRRALQSGQTIRVANDQISTPTYNWDLANAAIALVRAEAGGVFHVCGPERLSRFEFARRAAQAMGMDESHIAGIPTEELGQAARRPLDAGLSTQQLHRFPALPPMRGIWEGVRTWAAESVLEMGV